MDEETKQKLEQANHYIGIGQLEKAISIGKSITHPVVQSVVLGSAYMQKRQYRKALPHFLLLLKNMPDDSTVLENLSICRIELNNGVIDEESRKLIEKAYPDAPEFQYSYTEALVKTGTPITSGRRSRFFWLLRQYMATRDLEGRVAECGCWQGLSVLLICKHEKAINESYSGEGFDVFDSFEGLSKPTNKDPFDRPDSKQGAFSASLSSVKNNLNEFPDLSFHKGWIPECFPTVENQSFKFVHVDVDLYEPTNAAIRFFFPRLCVGGRIVCDDYNWSGARDAVNTFAGEVGVPVEISPNNQAVLVKS